LTFQEALSTQFPAEICGWPW